MKYFTLFFSILFVSCATPYVGTDYDRDFDFSKIKTYQIKVIENQGMGQLDFNHFSQLLEKALQEKGYVQMKPADIEIEILSNESISKDQSASVGLGGGSYGTGFGGGFSVGVPINVKKLNKSYFINIYNQQNHLIWQGIYEVKKGMNADKYKIAEQAVTKLVKKFPPKK